MDSNYNHRLLRMKDNYIECFYLFIFSNSVDHKATKLKPTEELTQRLQFQKPTIPEVYLQKSSLVLTFFL